jgi:hypothetical protein
MPWCTGCDRFLSPATVKADGTCPRCGRLVDPGRARAPEPVEVAEPGASDPTRASAAHAVPVPEADPDDDAPIPLPWHFKLLVGAIALYLGWRAFQGIEWVVRVL